VSAWRGSFKTCRRTWLPLRFDANALAVSSPFSSDKLAPDMSWTQPQDSLRSYTYNPPNTAADDGGHCHAHAGADDAATQSCAPFCDAPQSYLPPPLHAAERQHTSCLPRTRVRTRRRNAALRRQDARATYVAPLNNFRRRRYISRRATPYTIFSFPRRGSRLACRALSKH